MDYSATELGRKYGLSAEEMNQLLKDQGFLDGEPGNYSSTARGAPYFEERHFNRGTGGYQKYNRSWTTRRIDGSIKSELDTSHEALEQARERVKERRLSRSQRPLRDVVDAPEHIEDVEYDETIEEDIPQIDTNVLIHALPDVIQLLTEGLKGALFLSLWTSKTIGSKNISSVAKGPSS